MSRFDLLRDRHRGERCVIVANGPSLNAMPLARLRGEHVIGLNKIFLGLADFGFYPRYLVAVNPHVVVQAREQIRALNCVKFVSRRAARAAALPPDGLTHLVETDPPPARFSTDLALGLHEGWTVTYAALQVAYHLGFAHVVLIGLDHRYVFEGRPNETRTMRGRDPNHFSDRYFGDGEDWDNPDLARSEESYRIALRAFAADGRSIADATPGGACPVFPRVDFDRAVPARPET
jgi:hypothetical protein